MQASIGLFDRGVMPLYSQYVLQLQRIGASQTRVIAVPHKYEGERDVSRGRKWSLAGDQGLRSEWRGLFDAIQAGL